MQKYLIFLLGFEVTLQDRRTGEEEGGFIIIPFPEEHPDDLADVHPVIKNYYDRLGYDVKMIKYQDTAKKKIDLKAEYDAARKL